MAFGTGGIGSWGGGGGGFSGGSGGGFGFLGGSGYGKTKSSSKISSAFTQQITADTYGKPIPLTRGTRLVDGALLWATSVKTFTKTTTTVYGSGGSSGFSSGGSGGFSFGGGGSATPPGPPPDPTTTIEVTKMLVDLAIGFGRPLNSTRTAKILQLRVGNTVIYDTTSGRLETTKGVTFEVYPGSETQMPDPLMEQYLGAGNVPAYRGEIYAVFKSFDLLHFGGVLPMISALIADDGEVTVPFVNITPDPIHNDLIGWDRIRGYMYAANDETLFRIKNSVVVSAVSPPLGFGGLQATLEPIEWLNMFVNADDSSANTGPISIIDANTGLALGTFGVAGSSTNMDNDSFSSTNFFIAQQVAAQGGSFLTYVLCGSFLGGLGLLKVSDEGIPSYAGHDNSFPVMTTACRGMVTATTSFVYCATGSKIFRIDLVKGLAERAPDTSGELDVPSVNDVDGWLDLDNYGITEVVSLHYVQAENCLIVFGTRASDGICIKIDCATRTAKWVTPLPNSAGVKSFTRPKSNISAGTIGYLHAGVTPGVINIASGTLKTEPGLGANLSDYFWDSSTYSFFGERQTNDLFAQCFVAGAYGARFNLSDLLEELAVFVGYELSQIYVDPEIDDIIDGFVLPDASNVDYWTLVKTIGEAFSFYVTEDGNGISFRHRTRIGAEDTVQATLVEADLALIQRIDYPVNSNDPFQNAAINTARKRPDDVFDFVHIVYRNPTQDYQTAVAAVSRARHPDDAGYFSNKNKSIDIPFIIIRTDEATNLAANILFNNIASRLTHTFRLPTKQCRLEPGDVVQITLDDGVVYRIMLNRLTLHTDHSLSLAGEDYLYGPTDIEREAQELLGGATLSQIVNNNSQIIMFDTPMLIPEHELDDGFISVYYGVAGFGQANWETANVFQYRNEQFQQIGSVGTQIVAGFLRVALDDNDAAIDETSTIEFFVESGLDTEFSTVAEDNWLGGAYIAIVGAPGRWEIISIREFTLLGDNFVSATGIIRGLRDTYMNQSTSAVGDRIIFPYLRRSLRASIEPTPALPASRAWLAVGTEQGLLNAPVARLALTFEAQRPMSVVGYRAIKDSGDHDVTLSWRRQSRLQNAWMDEGEDPAELEFALENYRLEILDEPGGAIVRTMTGTATLYLYTVANQIIDGFAQPMSRIAFQVTQLSTEYGDGRTVQENPIVEAS